MRRNPEAKPGTLGDLAVEELNVWCWCYACSHNSVLETLKLIEHLGLDYEVPSVHMVLICSECGARFAHAKPDWPDPIEVFKSQN